MLAKPFQVAEQIESFLLDAIPFLTGHKSVHQFQLWSFSYKEPLNQELFTLEYYKRKLKNSAI